MTGNGRLRYSFVVRVTHQEHNSWQGFITHVETGKEFVFRSVFEMLMMMDTMIEADKDGAAIPQGRRHRGRREAGQVEFIKKGPSGGPRAKEDLRRASK